MIEAKRNEKGKSALRLGCLTTANKLAAAFTGRMFF